MLDLYEYLKKNNYRYVRIDNVKYRINYEFVDDKFVSLVRQCSSKLPMAYGRFREEYKIDGNTIILPFENVECLR